VSISYINGDLLASTMETLVCPTNCVGIMGAGLAAKFARRFPEVADAYNRSSKDGQVSPGVLVLSRGPGAHNILMFPTKRHWRDLSRLEDIVAGLANIRVFGIQSIAVPALGCGLGGLDWEIVRPLMEQYLGALDIPVEIYPPKER